MARWLADAGVRTARIAGALLMLLLLGTAALGAQGTTTGAIHGRVTDGAGASVAGAQVRLTEAATGRGVDLQTDGRGEFLAAALAPGVYRGEISAPGFATVFVAVAEVQLGSRVEFRVGLRPAGAAAEVTVTASADDEAGANASTITAEEIAQLPVNGRRWQDLALLTPQANPASDDGAFLSFRGLDPTENSTRLDGVDDDQSYSAAPRGSGRESGPEVEDEVEDAGATSGGQRGYAAGAGAGRHPGMAYSFSEAAVREFRVSGQNDSALYGHAAGGVINTVSRSGTNQTHGGLFYLARTSAFAARDPYAIATQFHDGLVTSEVVKPHDLRQQFGGTVGGAARTDRLFYFGAFDGQRRGFPAISTPVSASFYALSPIQTALLGTRGITGGQTMAALNYLDSLTGEVARRQDQTVSFGKLDWTATERNRLSVEYNRARSSSPAGGRTTAVVNRGTASFGNTDVSVDAVIGRWIATPNARLTNELRAQYGRDLHLERAQTPLTQEPAISVGGLAPEIAIGPEGLIFGTPASVGQGPAPDERRTQAAEVLTWVHGQHLLQIGGDFSYVQDHVQTLANAEGTFNYDSGATNGHAGGLVDWITDYTLNVNHTPNGGCPSAFAAVHYFCFRSYSQSFGAADTRFGTQEWAAFMQDEWRVRKGLSVSAGLRYEYEYLPLPQQPNRDLDRVFEASGATSVFPEDRDNVGPRLGLAWQPFGERLTTVRAGYGLYFGRLPGATVRSLLVDTALPSTVTRIRILPTVETACPQVENQGFGYPCAFLTAPPAGVVSTTSAMLFDRRFRLPTSQQATFSVERQVSQTTTVHVGYLLSLTRQLPNSTDVNIAPAAGRESFVVQGGPGRPGLRDGETFSLPVYTSRVDAAYGPVTDVLSNVNASYNALELEARRQSHAGLSYRVSWTWSKAIDFGQNGGAEPRTNGQLDPFDIRYDKGLSNLNYPQKLVASAVWAPSVKPGSIWRRRLGSGWTVSPIFTESSGRPYSYDIFGGTRLAGGHESINGSGGWVYLPTVGRDVSRLPEGVEVDLRVSREVQVRERARLRVQAEAFNLANHRNVSAVEQRAFLAGTPAAGLTPLVFQDAATIAAEGLTTTPFGALLGDSSGQANQRQVQVGLRLEF